MVLFVKKIFMLIKSFFILITTCLSINLQLLSKNTYSGILPFTHSAPHPTVSLGNSSYPGRRLAPLLRYAFTFSPYRNESLPFTIPHSIKRAQAPVANGAAKEVPVKEPYEPPGRGAVMSTPGATKSGFP